MSTDSQIDEKTLTPILLVCRIIAGALAGGVVILVVAAISIRGGQPPVQTFVASVAAGFAGVILVLRQVVLGVLARGGGQAPDTSALLRLYQVRFIVGVGMLEGAALFNGVAYLLEGNWWSLAVVGVLLAFMLAAFPTRMGIQQWVDDRLRQGRLA